MHKDAHLDAVFAALADPTRRAVLARLKKGEATVRDLAAPFVMSQPSEPAGTEEAGRSKLLAGAIPAVLGPSFNRLDRVLAELQPNKKAGK